MQLSTKVRYAIRAMVDMAMQPGGEPVKLKDIASRQDISLKYLEQVMLPLRVNAFVVTRKGSRGGYTLTRPPREITLLEIVKSVEGSVAPVECADDPNVCERSEHCSTHLAWIGLKEAIEDQLGRISLEDLAEKQQLLY
jgi:Rrf2 family protein